MDEVLALGYYIQVRYRSPTLASICAALNAPYRENSMDRFVARANISHFRDRLRTEPDGALRSTLQKLLVEEEDKLAIDLSLLADLAREIVKCQQWIERQRLRIGELERDGHDATAAITLLNGVSKTLILHQEYRQRIAIRLEQNLSYRETRGDS